VGLVSTVADSAVGVANMLPYGVLLAGLLASVLGQDCQFKSTNGSDYRGSGSVTVSGLECQEWGRQEPHPHVHGELPGNLCRWALTLHHS